jgi:hypothetical protein
MIEYNIFIELSGVEEPRLVNAFVPDSDSDEGKSHLSTLKRSSEIVAHLLFAAMAQAPSKNALFRDVAQEMCRQAQGLASLSQAFSSKKSIEEIIQEEFEKCEILGEQAAQRPRYSFTQWCGTLSEAHSSLTWPVRHLPKAGKPKRYSRSRLPLSSL